MMERTSQLMMLSTLIKQCLILNMKTLVVYEYNLRSSFTRIRSLHNQENTDVFEGVVADGDYKVTFKFAEPNVITTLLCELLNYP